MLMFEATIHSQTGRTSQSCVIQSGGRWVIPDMANGCNIDQQQVGIESVNDAGAASNLRWTGDDCC